jgi:hypothetical protein
VGAPEPITCDLCGTAIDDASAEARFVEITATLPEPDHFRPPLLLAFCSEDHFRQRLAKPLPEFDPLVIVKRESRMGRAALASLGVAAVSIFLVTWVIGLITIWKWIWT